MADEETSPLPSSVTAIPELSIVIPCYNEQDNVRNICAAVTAEVERMVSSHEIILIDNGSADRTRALIREICAEDARIRAIFNNRNYGQMRSPTHGIYQARGRAVIGMCADFQDPPAMIGPFVDQWRRGAQVVLGQRKTEKASFLTGMFRSLGYGFLKRFADYAVVPGATGFGLFDREVVDMLATWNEPEPFFRGMVVESGYRLAVIPFDRPERAAGETKNNLRTLTDFALSGIAGSAKSLLRLPIIMAAYIMMLAGLLMVATAGIWAWGGDGWPMLILAALMTMFGVLMLFVGLIGEQVRMISERTRNVPLVIEAERINFESGAGQAR